MKLSRAHESTTVLVRFNGGEYWEEWRVRTNRGSKQSKPVKFFADRTWQSNNKLALTPFCATRGDFPSEREAREYFSSQVAFHGGEVVAITPQLSQVLAAKFGRSAA
jgi:hypothetical protein